MNNIQIAQVYADSMTDNVKRPKLTKGFTDATTEKLTEYLTVISLCLFLSVQEIETKINKIHLKIEENQTGDAKNLQKLQGEQRQRIVLDKAEKTKASDEEKTRKAKAESIRRDKERALKKQYALYLPFRQYWQTDNEKDD